MRFLRFCAPCNICRGCSATLRVRRGLRSRQLIPAQLRLALAWSRPGSGSDPSPFYAEQGQSSRARRKCLWPGAGCDCKANWTYAGETWHGCANPDDDWPSPWCYINTKTCLPGAWACAIEQGLWCAGRKVCMPRVHNTMGSSVCRLRHALHLMSRASSHMPWAGTSLASTICKPCRSSVRT